MLGARPQAPPEIGWRSRSTPKLLGSTGDRKSDFPSERPLIFREYELGATDSSALFLDAIAEEPLGIDRVETQPVFELFAQFADVALDDVFIDIFVEESVDGVEDLRLADAPSAAAQQKFQDPSLPAGKRKRFVVHLGLAPIEIDAQFADRNVALLAQYASIDRADPSHDLAHMHGLPQNVVSAGREEAQGVIERVTLVETENRRTRPLADEPRQRLALVTVADHERFDNVHVRITDLADPFAKFGRFDSCRRNAFAIKTVGIASGHHVPIVDNNIHTRAPAS